MSPMSCSSSASPVQARAWPPAAFQLLLSGMCVSVSGLQPSPSAPIPLSICQHKEKRAQFCSSVASLISLSNTCLIPPLLHLLCAQCHTSEEKVPAATAQADSTPKHSAWVWLLDLLQALSFLLCSSTGPSCHRVAPRGVPTPTGASWPCLPCSPWPRCQPDTVPQLPSLCHIHHRHSDDFTGSSSSIYMASTQLPLYHLF